MSPLFSIILVMIICSTVLMLLSVQAGIHNHIKEQRTLKKLDETKVALDNTYLYNFSN
jgi:predicted lysophospholipase L1 biosynthesis ABC-type transport system permease subunit